MTASSLSLVASGYSPLLSFSEELEVVSGDESKSNKQAEGLPGTFHPIFNLVFT